MAHIEIGDPTDRPGMMDRLEAFLGARSVLEGVAVFLLVLYAALLGLAFASGPLGISEGFSNDFIVFWSGSHFALNGDFLTPYNYDAFNDYLSSAFGQKGMGFYNPPTFYFYVFPFALFSYPVAMALFQVLSLALLAFVSKLLARRREAAWMFLAFPGVLFCVRYGQNGILNAALIGGAIAAMDRGRPVLAGILIGLLAYKPHMGLLIPFALLAGREYRVFLSAAFTTVGVAVLSVLVVGVEPWIAFLDNLNVARTCLLDSCVNVQQYASVFGFFRQFGMHKDIAMVLQAVAGGIVLVSVVWVWSRPLPVALKGALLVAGVGVASPYFFDYDTALLVIPVILVGSLGLSHGFLRYERLSLGLAIVVMFVSRGHGLPVPVALIGLAPIGFFLIVMRRVLATRKAPPLRMPAGQMA